MYYGSTNWLVLVIHSKSWSSISLIAGAAAAAGGDVSTVVWKSLREEWDKIEHELVLNIYCEFSYE